MRILVAATSLVMVMGLPACDDTPTAPAPGGIPLLADRHSWSPSSTPGPYRTVAGQVAILPASIDRGLVVWFSHPAVTAGEFFPALDDEARQRKVPTLELLFRPQPGVDSWGGLVLSLEDAPLDPGFVGSLELWVNDFVPWTRRDDRRGELRFDVGRVSEDAVWDPRVPPDPENGILDFEDRDRSGGQIGYAEDTGLDGVHSMNEVFDPSRSGGDPDTDPAGDDRALEVGPFRPEDSAEQRLLAAQGINGTESNYRSDTEDLNGDGVLQTRNDYLEFLVDLSSSASMDVVRDSEVPLRPDRNGWRRYLIPFDEPQGTVGDPDGNFIRHIRIWVRGTEPGALLNLQIAGFRVLGRDGSALLGQGIPGDPGS